MNLAEIGKAAFANCQRLRELTIPNSVTIFGAGVFEGVYVSQSTGVTIYCYQGSKAAQYAQDNIVRNCIVPVMNVTAD